MYVVAQTGERSGGPVDVIGDSSVVAGFSDVLLRRECDSQTLWLHLNFVEFHWAAS